MRKRHESTVTVNEERIQEVVREAHTALSRG